MAVAAALLTAGCGGGPVSPGADGDCADSAVTITAPAADAVLSPGPATIAGTTALADRTVNWSVRDDSGAVRSSGSATSTADADGTAATFTVPVTLEPGGYRISIQPAVDGSCPTATTSGQVAPDAGPRWRSGAAGSGVADGSFAAWRGSAVPIAGTWADNNEAQVEQWTLQPDGELASWNGDLDVAIGAIDEGETWAEAAAGAYDARWTQSVQEMAERWAGRPGTLYIRFAHEFNGDWYPWSVTADTVGDFIASWHRFRAIQQQWFPTSRLVMAPNSQTPPSNDLDWRVAYPGPGQVDVMATSYFNHWPWTDTAEAFQEKALDLDHVGAPRGLQRHLEFARSVGLPFAVSEWGNEAWSGDSADFMRQMYGFFNANAGTGPGQVTYEVLFNVRRDPNVFAVFPDTEHPRAAEAYNALW
jgi:hypothetical protein